MTKPFKFIELVQRSEEWHEYRRTRVGSSDIASIAGTEGAYSKRGKVLDEKLGITQASHSDYLKVIMKEGDEWEEAIIKKACETLEEYNPRVVESTVYPRFFASLDGMNNAGNKIIEVKATTKEDYLCLAELGICPAIYSAQIQWQLLVTGLSEALLLVVDRSPGVEEKKPHQVFVRANPSFQADLVKHAQEFLKDLDEGNSTTVAINDSEADLWHIVDAKIAISAAEQIVEELKQKVKSLSENLLLKYNAKKIIHPKLLVEECYRKGSVDYAKIDDLKNVDLEKYRKKGMTYLKITLRNDDKQIESGNENETI